MTWMPNGQEVERGFNKLTNVSDDPGQGLKLRKSSEKFGYYFVDGIRQFHASSKARQSGDVRAGRSLALRKQLGLTLEQFKELCMCQMTGPQFHELVRERIERKRLMNEPADTQDE